MSLSLEITPRGTGRTAIEVEMEVVRELTLEDLPLLDSARQTRSNPLKRITDRHHALARVIASGIRHGEAAVIVGYEPSRVSILMDDPTFMELVGFYRSMRDEEFRTVHERLAGVTADALDLISERFEDEETRKTITLNQAMEVAKLGADRTGFGPASSTTATHIHVGLAERMEAARRKAREAAKTIEILPAESAS